MLLATGYNWFKLVFIGFSAVAVAVAKNFNFVATAMGPVGPSMVKKPDPTRPANSTLNHPIPSALHTIDVLLGLLDPAFFCGF
jgi:hypothetical protein